MRPILPADLDIAARVLLNVPATERRAVMARLVGQADIADRYRKRLGKAHPDYGSGSLMAAALRHHHDGPARHSDDAYCVCLVEVLGGLAAFRARVPQARTGR